MSSISARMKKIELKIKALEWPQNFSHYKSMGLFRDNSTVHDRIWLKFELIRDIMAVPLNTCKNEDPIKTKGARVATRLYVDFSEANGQIIP